MSTAQIVLGLSLFAVLLGAIVGAIHYKREADRGDTERN